MEHDIRTLNIVTKKECTKNIWKEKKRRDKRGRFKKIIIDGCLRIKI